MRIVFCGTPQFAVPSLRLFLTQSDFELVAVITQPDRPRGRGHDLFYSPVKQVALEAKVPVHQPQKIRVPEIQEILQTLAPDVIVIIAYGQIIPARLLPIPRLGWINLHASLLPKYRGAAPINWVIVNGETHTGVTTMRIDAGMDTGDILLQRQTTVGPTETAPELAGRLAELGAPLMVETLRGIAAGSLIARPQDHSVATHAPMLKKEDGLVDWSLRAEQIFNRMRGFAPWPGAYTMFRGEICHISGAPDSRVGRKGLPGSLILMQRPKTELLVVCGGETVLRLESVKREGRKEIGAGEFANGARMKAGERFGDS
jgi:methionyl-tRNA formyltransferase